MRALLLVALAVASLAVTAAAPAQKAPTDQPDAAISDGSAQRALDAAEAKWRRQAVRDYRLRVARSCFCPEEVRRPATITVRNGRPVNPPEHLEDVASVTRLFRAVQRSIDDEVVQLTVRYDTRRGFPRTISIDRSRMIADEEAYYSADRFSPLRRSGG